MIKSTKGYTFHKKKRTTILMNNFYFANWSDLKDFKMFVSLQISINIGSTEI